MKKVLLLVLIMALALLVAGISGTNVPDNDLASIVNQTDNPGSATATIPTTTMPDLPAATSTSLLKPSAAGKSATTPSI